MGSDISLFPKTLKELNTLHSIIPKIVPKIKEIEIEPTEYKIPLLLL